MIKSQQINAAVAAYRAGVPAREICKQYHIGAGTLYRWLATLGIQRMRKKGRQYEKTIS